MLAALIIPDSSEFRAFMHYHMKKCYASLCPESPTIFLNFASDNKRLVARHVEITLG